MDKDQIYPSRFCVLCHGIADFMCLRCRDPYCSSKCQKMDWPQHKSTCFPMPMLVRVASEENLLNSSSSIRPPSPLKSLQPLAMPTSNVGVNGNISNGTSLADNENHMNGGNLLRSITNCAEKIPINDKPDGSNSKTMYFKSHKMDAGDMRKTKITATTEPMRLPNKTVRMESIPSIVASQPEKSIDVEKAVEVPVKIVEKPEVPAKMVEKPKVPEKIVEVLKVPEKTVEEPKVIKKTIEVSKVQESKPERIEPPTKSEIWMKPFPMEEDKFVSVVVQYVAPDNTIYVMHEKNECASNQLLREINKAAPNAPTPALEEIKVKSMFTVLFEHVHYRAVVLEPVSSVGTVLVRLIDYGNEIILPIDELKSPIPVMATQMAYSFPIKFQNPRKAEIGDKFKVKMEGIEGDVVTVIVEGEPTLITMKDIEVVPMPIGVKKSLFCLDFSNIPKGYIAACVYDERAMQQTEQIGAKITDHCKRLKDAYSPKVDELCLSLFEDGQWYRAVAVDVKDADTFDIMFIDYGNITTVNSSSIRKMPQEFMHKCLMNECYIKGFPKNPSKDDIQNMALYFNDNQIFEVEAVQMENGRYIIDPAL